MHDTYHPRDGCSHGLNLVIENIPLRHITPVNQRLNRGILRFLQIPLPPSPPSVPVSLSLPLSVTHMPTCASHPAMSSTWHMKCRRCVLRGGKVCAEALGGAGRSCSERAPSWTLRWSHRSQPAPCQQRATERRPGLLPLGVHLQKRRWCCTQIAVQTQRHHKRFELQEGSCNTICTITIPHRQIGNSSVCLGGYFSALLCA